MTDVRRPGAATAAFLAAESARIAARCTACGRCVTACPMTAYAPGVAAADPRDVVEGVLDLLRGGPSTAVSLAWVNACTRSGVCTAACGEEGIDPAFMLRLAKANATGALGGEARITLNADPQFSPKVKAFARLTLTEQEQTEWL